MIKKRTVNDEEDKKSSESVVFKKRISIKSFGFGRYLKSPVVP